MPSTRALLEWCKLACAPAQAPCSDNSSKICGFLLLLDHETKLCCFVPLLVPISNAKRVPLWIPRDAHPVVVQVDPDAVDRGVAQLRQTRTVGTEQGAIVSVIE